jgi:chemotaxis protein CheC
MADPATSADNRTLTTEEIDILQEIMNIAFGTAAAELAEVINIFVELSVPYIRLISAEELPAYVRQETRDIPRISMVEQRFWGKFKGSAFLVFPADAGRVFISLFEVGSISENDPGESIDILENETLIEVGNILIGACVGKVSELLGDSVTYSPPSVLLGNHPNDDLPRNFFDPANSAVVLKTVFSFQERDLSGFLFLVTSNDSVQWLRHSLKSFMEQYE